MQGLMSLFEWYNLVYTLPFGLAVLLMIVSALGMGGQEHDLDHDHDADLDHDFDHDADHDVEAEPGHSGGHGGEGHDAPVVHTLLSLLGVGKVPITVLVQSFLVSWAVIGWNVNIWLAKALKVPEAFILPSVGISFCGALASMRLLASLFHKLMPGSETYAKGPLDLLSATGTAVFKIDRAGGYADVYDDTRTLHRVHCRSQSGVLPRGSRVMLVDYHSDGTYEVRPVNEHGEPTVSRRATADSVHMPVPAAQTREIEPEAED